MLAFIGFAIRVWKHGKKWTSRKTDSNNYEYGSMNLMKSAWNKNRNQNTLSATATVGIMVELIAYHEINFYHDLEKQKLKTFERANERASVECLCVKHINSSICFNISLCSGRICTVGINFTHIAFANPVFQFWPMRTWFMYIEARSL